MKTRSVNFKESKMSRPIFYIFCHEEDKLIKQLDIFKSYDSHTQGKYTIYSYLFIVWFRSFRYEIYDFLAYEGFPIPFFETFPSKCNSLTQTVERLDISLLFLNP